MRYKHPLPLPEFWLPGDGPRTRLRSGVRRATLFPPTRRRTQAIFQPTGTFAWFDMPPFGNIGQAEVMLPYVNLAVIEPVSADFVCK